MMVRYLLTSMTFSLLLLLCGCRSSNSDTWTCLDRGVIADSLAPCGVATGDIVDVWGNLEGDRLYARVLAGSDQAVYVFDRNERTIRMAVAPPDQTQGLAGRPMWIDRDKRIRLLPRVDVGGDGLVTYAADQVTGAFCVYSIGRSTAYIGCIAEGTRVVPVHLPTDFSPCEIALRDGYVYLFDWQGAAIPNYWRGPFKDAICLRPTATGFEVAKRFRLGGLVQFVDRTGRRIVVTESWPTNCTRVFDTQSMRMETLAMPIQPTAVWYVGYKGDLQGYRLVADMGD